MSKWVAHYSLAMLLAAVAVLTVTIWTAWQRHETTVKLRHMIADTEATNAKVRAALPTMKHHQER